MSNPRNPNFDLTNAVKHRVKLNDILSPHTLQSAVHFSLENKSNVRDYHLLHPFICPVHRHGDDDLKALCTIIHKKFIVVYNENRIYKNSKNR